jgi:CIC family chloride channel protein
VRLTLLRAALRRLRGGFGRLEGAWRDLLVALLVGVLGALAVAGFRHALLAMEVVLVGAHEGHLVAAASVLTPASRLLIPAGGALAAGLLLWFAERRRGPDNEGATRYHGDYIEAVVVGRGLLDLRGGTRKAIASLLVVSTGGAVGREGAMVLTSAMAASLLGRLIGRSVDLRLVVSCGAAAGLAAAYHAPLAGAMFVAEILLGTLALSHLGPVVVAAVMAYAVETMLAGHALLFDVPPIPVPGPAQVAVALGLGLAGGVAGAGLLRWLRGARQLFADSRLPQPAAFALGGLIVGALSLWRPEVWGNGYSVIELLLGSAQPWGFVALVLALKLVAVAATTGSGAPGGVFTPTLFIGASAGVLATSLCAALGLPPAAGPLYAVVGMAALLSGTTHAPVMAAFMIFEMTGQYRLLPILLPVCVLATLVSYGLQPKSVYGLDAHAARPAGA